MRFSALSATAVLAVLAAGSAQADCRFHNTQYVNINSTHWNDVLFYNYTSAIPTVAGAHFGSRTPPYTPVAFQWYGTFVYDYAQQKYVAAQYSQIENFPIRG